ncbi:MAG: hypothetical protein ACK6A7_00750 [Planctomycetota bacterium]
MTEVSMQTVSMYEFYRNERPRSASPSKRLNESQKRLIEGLASSFCSSIIIVVRIASYNHVGVNMPTTADDAKSFYEAELKESLEREFLGQHVAIVSESRRHFVRPTFLEAALAAREAEPDHVPFVIRIGHDAAIHIGAVSF